MCRLYFYLIPEIFSIITGRMIFLVPLGITGANEQLKYAYFCCPRLNAVFSLMMTTAYCCFQLNAVFSLMMTTAYCCFRLNAVFSLMMPQPNAALSLMMPTACCCFRPYAVLNLSQGSDFFRLSFQALRRLFSRHPRRQAPCRRAAGDSCRRRGQESTCRMNPRR